MKKLLAILLALAMVVTCFAACGKDKKAEDKPADKATDVPAAVTDEPVVEPTEVPTEAPTAEPTAEPTPKDPHAQEVLDYDDYEGGIQNYSFDTIFFDNTTITDGGVAGWKTDNDETIDGKDGSIKVVGLRGWLGFQDQDFIDIGYVIDDGYVRFGSGTFVATEDPVKAAGGQYAQRFRVDIPVATLAGEGHTICAVLMTEDGQIVKINGGLNPYELYYDGPATVADPEVDGTVNAAEYDFKYTMNKDNFTTWTKGTFEGNVDYYFRTTADALYIGIIANGVAAGDLIQINFNPNSKLDAVPGQFLSIVTGDTPKVLQHNHKNGLLADNNADGADITSLVTAAYVKGEDGSYNMEVKIPVAFFQTADVEGADTFAFAKGNTLYFGIFNVIGGNGYGLQKDIDYTDWTCKGLDLYQMAIVF